MRSSSLVRLHLLLLLFSCCGAGVAKAAGRRAAGKDAASAGKESPGKEDRATRKARELAGLAEAAKVRGNPAVALQLFQQAHDLKPLPIFLYRMAQCHKAMGNAGRAAFSLRQYLKYATDIPDRGEVEDMAQRMERLATAVREDGGPEGEGSGAATGQRPADKPAQEIAADKPGETAPPKDPP
jgi:hypothetical protein